MTVGTLFLTAATRSSTKGLRRLALAFVESRPIVQAVFALRFVVGGLLSNGQANGLRIFEGGLAWILAVWFVYLLNGLSDISGDRQNGSRRPLASGALDRRFASNVCLVLLVSAIALATLIGIAFVLMVASMLLLGGIYSMGAGAAKRSAFPALVVAALGSSLTYLAGSEVLASLISVQSIAFALVTGAWIIVAGHCKDFGDTAGDISSGRRTLPILIGERGARRFIARAALLVGLVAFFIAWVVPGVPTLGLLFPGAIALFVALRSYQGTEIRSVEKAPYRTFMIVQYLVNVTTLFW